MKISENNLARHIALREGLARELSIAQVKEVLRHTLDILANDHNLYDVVALLRKHGPTEPF